jgi:two-component system chemotaxis sensor kinase CheA
MATVFSDEDRAILQDFITESREAIEKTESVLLELEEKIESLHEIEPAVIDKIFRTFHSIKGSAEFIGLKTTSRVTHHAETLLDKIRKGKTQINKDHIEIYLNLCDFFYNLLESVSENFSEEGFEERAENLVERINSFISGAPAAAPEKPETDESMVIKPEMDDYEPAMTAADLEALVTPEMIQGFVVEAREMLDSVEQDLLALEKEPVDNPQSQNAFRTIHSLKGNAGLLGYTDIASICHHAESFLDHVRNGSTAANSDQFTFILKVFDFVSKAIEEIAEGKAGKIPGKMGLIDLMKDLLGVQLPAETAEPEPEKETAPEPEPDEKVTETKPVVEIPKLNQDREVMPEPVAKAEVKSAGGNGKKEINEVIRVDIKKLNHLMDLVGEIVIAESMVAQHPDIISRDMPDFEKSILHLQKNIRELQELSTSMRMIPLSGLFAKMRRLVRDIASKSKKKVELVIFGGETEVDRSVLEHISDPLVHIIRNSVDHGIEAPEDRSKKGKNPVGQIVLEAKQVGGEIWIIIRDDGAGLNRDRIVSKALEKGLLTEAELETVSDQKVWSLIFAPGFSTAAKVTSISGRGVGMDVVQKNLDKIRGRCDVQSTGPQGTTLVLRIPLTTAIVDGMLMRIANSIYAVPTLDIKESLQIRSGDITTLTDGQEVVKIRNKLVPIVRLEELHDLGVYEKREIDEGIVVVVGTGEETICIFADELIGQRQLVIKPLPDYLGNIEGVSGCAILGDGNISLILDITNLIKLANSLTV